MTNNTYWLHISATYWVHVFSKCLSNLLTIGDGYIHYFRKIFTKYVESAGFATFPSNCIPNAICGFEFNIKCKINRSQTSGIGGDWASPKHQQNVSNIRISFPLNFWWLLKKLSAVKRLTSILWKLFLLPKWRKWPITPIYFTFQQTYWMHAFSKCLSNPLAIGDGYIRCFRKILPLLYWNRDFCYFIFIRIPKGYAGLIQNYIWNKQAPNKWHRWRLGFAQTSTNS